MLVAQEDVFYYVTTMNENYPQPAMPSGVEEGIRRGMYRVREARVGFAPRVQLLGSGTLLREALAAAELLERDHGIGADVWSVTSWTELRRDGQACDESGGQPWIARCLDDQPGPVVAVSDYVSAVPHLIRPWLDRRFVSLGTDGFGRSDTRAALRTFFGVDRAAIVAAARRALE
jgi:pyruvate dehydrogenase E1 component